MVWLWSAFPPWGIPGPFRGRRWEGASPLLLSCSRDPRASTPAAACLSLLALSHRTSWLQEFSSSRPEFIGSSPIHPLSHPQEGSKWREGHAASWTRRKLGSTGRRWLGAGPSSWPLCPSCAGHRGGHRGGANTTHHQSPEVQGSHAQPQDTRCPCPGPCADKGAGKPAEKFQGSRCGPLEGASDRSSLPPPSMEPLPKMTQGLQPERGYGSAGPQGRSLHAKAALRSQSCQGHLPPRRWGHGSWAGGRARLKSWETGRAGGRGRCGWGQAENEELGRGEEGGGGATQNPPLCRDPREGLGLRGP